MIPPPSSKASPRIFLSRKFRPGLFDKLGVIGNLQVHRLETPPSASAYRRAVRDVHVLIPMTEDLIDSALMDTAPHLGLVANFGVGFDNIDLNAATERGIVVTNTPSAVVEPTAELTMGLLLAVCRRIPEADDFMREGRWSKWTPSLLEGRSLFGKTLGIVGLGSIGATVARMANCFGMKTIYWSRRRRSPREEASLCVRYRSLNRLLAEAEFVSLHVALNDDTRHLIGEAELGRMKRGAILINTARGAVVDQRALVRFLKAGHLAGAGLDVFEKEPLQKSPLFQMRNVVMLPHLGTSTDQGLIQMAERVTRNVSTFLSGRRPPDLLNPDAWVNRRYTDPISGRRRTV